MAKRNPVFDIINVITTAKQIKADEEKREKSVRFGVTGIIFSIIAVVFAVGAALLLSRITGGDNNAMLLLIFVIAGVAVCVGGVLVLFAGALVRVIAQLTINKKPVGWLALGAFILCLIAAIVLFIVLL